HGAVQRVPIEALSRRFDPWFLPLGRWRWCRGKWHVIRWAVGNRGGLGGRIGFGQQGKSSFRGWLPSQSTENFSNHHLTESQSSTNPAIAQAASLEAQNRTVACRRLGPRRTAGGSSLRADEGVQSSRVQALLKATQGSRGVTERACQIVLIDVSGLVERNQGIGFGRAILSGVVGVDDTMDENDALVGFDLKGNGVIDKHHLGNGREVGEKITCMRIRVHGRIGCPSFPEKKSGQVLVRTLGGKNSSQMRQGSQFRTTISPWQTGGMAGASRGDRKGGHVAGRTVGGKISS